MSRRKCKVCDDDFDPQFQTIEMSGVPDDYADEAFDLLIDGETCAECIVNDLAYKDSLGEP